MRLAILMLYGPAGQQLEIRATGQGQIVTEVHERLTFIRDTGMPMYPEPPAPPKKHPNDKRPEPQVNPLARFRIVGQVPSSWAMVPQWEIDSPADTMPADPEVIPNNVVELPGANNDA